MPKTIHAHDSKRKTTKRVRRPTGPDVSICTGGKPIWVSAAKMAEPEIVGRVSARVREADTDPVFTIRDLLAWPDDARSQLLQLIAKLERPYQIRFPDCGQRFDNLLEAVLHIAEKPANITRCTNSQRAAIEAAALLYPNSLETACQPIVDRFRLLGVRTLRVDHLVRQARNVIGQGDPTADPETAAVEFHAFLSNAGGVCGSRALIYFQDEFYTWDRNHWRRMPDKEIAATLTQFLQSQKLKVTKRFVQDVLTNLEAKVLVKGWNRQLPLWVVDWERGTAEPGTLITFANGMVRRSELLDGDAEEIELQEHDPRNFNEIVLPYEFDPQAECPLLTRTLEEILPSQGEDDHRLDVLQEFMGYSLISGDTTLEKFLILHGDGANGKSTVLHVWEDLLGPDNVSHVPLDAFGSQFGPVEMLGKLANIASDMNRMDKVQEGLLKSLTSGERMQLDRKHKRPITARFTAKLIFATNSLPPISDRSQGVWRRMIAMPFFQSFGEENRDRQRAERLLAELPGIFNWALEGARRLYAQGAFTGCSVCESCLAEYRHTSDPFRQFVADELQLDAGGEVGKAKIYSRYHDYCDQNGYHPKGSGEFGKQMLKLPGVAVGRLTRGRRPRTYTGVSLVPHEFTFASVALPPQPPARGCLGRDRSQPQRRLHRDSQHEAA